MLEEKVQKLKNELDYLNYTMNQKVVIPKFYENVRIISGNGQYC